MLEKIGKYEVSEQIGVGGFGAVYRGRDPFIKRTVAIKTCQVNDEEIKHRFFREAELAGNLHHRHITTIYDFGVENGIPYIVQEFLTGEDLDKKIKRGEPIPIARKIEILMSIADGLGYAHTASIIHRDVKPANVRILEDGTVKVMDFGIAKSLQSDSNLTQTGITLGTSAYLAPEQIRGEPIDRRTDIFALGVVAYELLTYRKPFRGEHLSTVLYKILNDTPEPIGSLVQDAPPALIAAVGRAMSKVPDDRYPTMEALRKDLQAISPRDFGLLGHVPDTRGRHGADAAARGGPRDDPRHAVERRRAHPRGHHAALGGSGPRARALGCDPDLPGDLRRPPATRARELPRPEARTRPTRTRSAGSSGAVRPAKAEPAAARSKSMTFVAIAAVLAAGIAAYFAVVRRPGMPAPAPMATPAPAPAVPTPAIEFPEPELGAGEAPADVHRRGGRARPRAPAAAAPVLPRRSPHPPRKRSPRLRRRRPRSRCSSRRFPWRRCPWTARRSARRFPPAPSRSKRESTPFDSRRPDFPPYEKKFRVGPKSENRVHYQFPISMLVIQAPGWAGARVLVDGKYRGSLPDASRLRLPPGSYSVTLSREGSSPVTEKVDVPEGSPKTWNAPPPSPAAAGGP